MKVKFLAVIALAAAVCSCGNTKTEQTNAEETTTTTASELAEATPAENQVIELGEDILIAPSDKPTVIDFSATWCGPCQAFKPIYHEVAQERASEFVFYTVDVDNCPKMAEAYSIQSIPTVAILMPDGKVITSEPGYMEKDAFNAFLNQAK